MVVHSQKYRRSTLSAAQVSLLELVYKYRFVSRITAANSLNINPQNGIYERLELLVKHGYLAKRYNPRLRLLGLPAAYYVTAYGLRALQQFSQALNVSITAIKASYRDKTVSQSFITHTLNVFNYTTRLKQCYPDLKVYTQRDMSQYDYFPPQLPDVFLSLPTNDPQQPKRFFLDVLSPDMPRSAVFKRVASYYSFFDEGGWDDIDSQLPFILLLCEPGLTEKQVQRIVRTQLRHSDLEHFTIYTGISSGLHQHSSPHFLWTNVEDSDESVELSQLS